MLESVFFITLGISCVLLMMLIYHFKQRISKLEKNGDTMFEILNNMVQELTAIKYSINNTSGNQIPSNFDYPDEKFEKINVSLNDDVDNVAYEKIDDELDSQNAVNETEEEDDDEYESDSEEETDDDETEEQEDEDDENSIQDSNDEQSVDGVKVISLDNDEKIDNNSLGAEPLENLEIDEQDVNLDNINTENIENIQVNKLEEVSTLEESSIQDSIIDNKDVYKKMTVAALKAHVIEKGLASDPSKMKKNELLELLDNN